MPVRGQDLMPDGHLPVVIIILFNTYSIHFSQLKKPRNPCSVTAQVDLRLSQRVASSFGYNFCLLEQWGLWAFGEDGIGSIFVALLLHGAC